MSPSIYLNHRLLLLILLNLWCYYITRTAMAAIHNIVQLRAIRDERDYKGQLHWFGMTMFVWIISIQLHVFYHRKIPYSFCLRGPQDASRYTRSQKREPDNNNNNSNSNNDKNKTALKLMSARTLKRPHCQLRNESYKCKRQNEKFQNQFLTPRNLPV